MKKLLLLFLMLLSIGMSHVWSGYQLVSNFNLSVNEISDNYYQFSWTECRLNNFAYYKLIYSYTDPDLYYNKNKAVVGVWYSDKKAVRGISSKDTGVLSSLDQGKSIYRRVCVFDTSNNQYCSNVVKTNPKQLTGNSGQATDIRFNRDSGQQAAEGRDGLHQSNTDGSKQAAVDSNQENQMQKLIASQQKEIEQKITAVKTGNFESVDLKTKLLEIKSLIEKSSLINSAKTAFLNQLSEIYNKQAAGNRQQATGNRQQATDGNKQATGNSYQVVGSDYKRSEENSSVSKSLGAIVTGDKQQATGLSAIVGSGGQSATSGSVFNADISASDQIQLWDFLYDPQLGTLSYLKLMAFIVGILVCLTIICIYLIEYIKGFFNKHSTQIYKRIEYIQRLQKKKKSSTSYIGQLRILYEKFLSQEYEVSPHFLANFLYSLLMRNILILFGKNGIGKTSFLRSLMGAMYGDNYASYSKFITLKYDIDGDKKFVGMYDRFNNNYIDPFGVTAFITRAYFDRKNPYFLILDEMNLSDIERYFPYYLDYDSVLQDGEGPFIKVGDISLADTPQIQQNKLALIQEYNFLVEEKDGIVQFGFRIPRNLFIVGTVNMEKSVEQFSSKLLDRADVIRFEFMGQKDYSQELKDISQLQWGLYMQGTFLSDPQKQDFLEKLKEVISVSKRSEKSMTEYLSVVQNIPFMGLENIILQKVLPKISGQEYKLQIRDLMELLNRTDPAHFKKSQEVLKKLSEQHFIDFWSL